MDASNVPTSIRMGGNSTDQNDNNFVSPHSEIWPPSADKARQWKGNGLKSPEESFLACPNIRTDGQSFTLSKQPVLGALLSEESHACNQGVFKAWH